MAVTVLNNNSFRCEELFEEDTKLNGCIIMFINGKSESEQPPNNRINIGLESEAPNLYDYFRIVTLENLYGTE